MKLITSLNIRYEFFILNDLKIASEKSAYDELVKCGNNYFEHFQLPLSHIPGVFQARNLFHQLKMDPTRHRPSSEALLRRAMKQKKFHSVNNLVDVCNWCALDFLLPNGVYDSSKIQGDIVLREGLENESYEGINNRQVNLAARYCLADDVGVFGSPITDSRRTSVDLHTQNACIIIYAPADYSAEILQSRKELMITRILRFCQ
ncbi:MAG: hypothetical protein JXQ65_09750 [Candidatus Marinimicrobia bacterium]|nr:hypothetical protein [Candidatus Neomarinimicrobiota bacterium]